jgi:hypothetical protein
MIQCDKCETSVADVDKVFEVEDFGTVPATKQLCVKCSRKLAKARQTFQNQWNKKLDKARRKFEDEWLEGKVKDEEDAE